MRKDKIFAKRWFIELLSIGIIFTFFSSSILNRTAIFNQLAYLSIVFAGTILGLYTYFIKEEIQERIDTVLESYWEEREDEVDGYLETITKEMEEGRKDGNYPNTSELVDPSKNLRNIFTEFTNISSSYNLRISAITAGTSFVLAGIFFSFSMIFRESLMRFGSLPIKIEHFALLSFIFGAVYTIEILLIWINLYVDTETELYS